MHAPNQDMDWIASIKPQKKQCLKQHKAAMA